VAIRRPAVPVRAADVAARRVTAVAVVARRGHDHPLLEGGDGVDRLERRPCRVHALERFAHERLVGLRVAQPLPLRVTEAVGPYGRVEGRVARQTEKLPVAHVHHDRGAPVRRPLPVPVGELDTVPQRRLGLLLDVGVQGEDEAVAGFRQAAAGDGFARLRPPHGVDLDLRHSVAAAKPAVVRRLDAALPDHVAGGVALVLPLLELLATDLAEVAEDLRRHGSHGVCADVVLAHFDAREQRLALEDARHHRARHVLGDDHQVITARTLMRVELPDRQTGRRTELLTDPPLRYFEDVSQTGDDLVEPAGGDVHRPDPYRKPRPVLDQHPSVAVEDGAARSHDLQRAQTVVVGLRLELCPAEDLQVPEAEEDHGDQHHCQPGQQRHAEGHRRRPKAGSVGATAADEPLAACRSPRPSDRHAAPPCPATPTGRRGRRPPRAAC